MKLVDQIQENVGIALETIRASKLRSALTILVVVIGFTTVMGMATIVICVQQQILRTIETAGPNTFYVFKAFSQTPLNPDNLPAWVRIRPDLQEQEAQILARLPQLSYASIWALKVGRVEYRVTRLQPNRIYGADSRFPEVIGGNLVIGRWFTWQEMLGGAAVVVLNEDYARRLFGRENPLGVTVQLAGRPAEVIGLYAPEPNVFEPPSSETAAIVPYRMLDQQFTIEKNTEMFIVAKARRPFTVPQAQEAVTIALREMRGLRPAQKNSFDLVTQEQILDSFNKLTGAFFLVLVALSSVGLLVGGIGVMAIMMVSVTSRTREIGVRKALGATRRDILLQFLIEAATLTGIGGIIGILFGMLVGKAGSLALGADSPVPIPYTVVAVVVSVGIGITFGMIPAQRAARLDPVEALRYE